MKWTNEAEAAIKKVPFFVRKKVRARVETEAEAQGKHVITLAEVHATRERFLKNMSAEVKGYQADSCFSQGSCPNMANGTGHLAERIEALLKDEDLAGFLRRTVGENIKFHHEFRVTLAECPNACSQPQIKDIGIIGACLPEITDADCTLCGACVDACRDSAVCLDEANTRPVIDPGLCLACGACPKACPTGTITEGRKGYRILLGGKLGRHPKLARPLDGIFSEDQVIDIVSRCIAFYKANSKKGARFADIYTGPKDIRLSQS
ncbi:MAG: 4Fe-4S dicluster domain-containing protein [Thermodesulfobacteriota bacterium]|nr:4Fe-4S dicluster domain-containing protein [Thermodesulfobacteriota bacterium]